MDKMRRWMLGLCVVAALGFGVAAWALDINSSKPVVRVLATTKYVVLDSAVVGNLYSLPTAYTAYSVDATDKFNVRRNFGGTWENLAGITVPAGQSVLFPAPPPVINAAGTHYRHFVGVAAHSDTVVFIPWVE